MLQKRTIYYLPMLASEKVACANRTICLREIDMTDRYIYGLVVCSSKVTLSDLCLSIGQRL